jgi:hypothetical protein
MWSNLLAPVMLGQIMAYFDRFTFAHSNPQTGPETYEIHFHIEITTVYAIFRQHPTAAQPEMFWPSVSPYFHKLGNFPPSMGCLGSFIWLILAVCS